jgi:hypothetical protein
MNQQDFVKKQLESLKNAKRGKNVELCLEIIGILNEYFDYPHKNSEISKCRQKKNLPQIN